MNWRKTAGALFGVLATVLSLVASATPETAPVARTQAGQVRGDASGAHIVFRGIPFAAPPVGKLRWTAPQPAAKWKEVRDATGQPHACSQQDYTWNRADHLSQSEDCLTLDIGTSSLTGRRPVLVWIHGGANYAGSANGTAETSMVDKGVVVVAIRYRLGALGFMMHRGIGEGNFAMQDQIAALRWVQLNIESFGGDPNQVTIAGESAGAQDVGLLVAAPAARGLFRRAIMESGTPGFGLPWRSREEALRIGDQVDAALGAQGDPGKLRAAAAWPVIVAGETTHDGALTDDWYRWLRTTVDGRLLPYAPERLLAEAPAVDVLIGTNRFELDLPGGRTHRDQFVADAYGANEDAARGHYELDRPDPAPDPRAGTRDQQIATDATFRCPALRFADLMARKGGHVWRYSFDASSDGGMTRHALELPYIYGDQRIGTLHLMDYWVNFVKVGDPNGQALPHWPAHGSGHALLEIDNEGARAATPPDAVEDICRLGRYL